MTLLPDSLLPLASGVMVGSALLAAREYLRAARIRDAWRLAGLNAHDPETGLLTLSSAETELHRLIDLACVTDAQLSSATIRVDSRDPAAAGVAITRVVRGGDIAWRTDDDTFAVLLLTPDRASAVQAVTRLLTAVEATQHSGSTPLAGISSWPDDGEDAWMLNERALARLAPIERWRSVCQLVNDRAA